ncbi:ornithine decarboxylase-like [Amblyomma americanum]
MAPCLLLDKVRFRKGRASGVWRLLKKDDAKAAHGSGRWASTFSAAPGQGSGASKTFIFSEFNPQEAAREIIKKQNTDDAFFVCDLRDIVRKAKLWRQCLPQVTPYYAIKCNGDPVLLNELASLGVNFDCSNTIEMKTILDMGVHPDRIIYAHPVKSTSHMKFAQENGVRLMTFDCAEELLKVTDKHAKLLLRIKGDDLGCRISFNDKFGCTVDQARHILERARALHCNVVGVAFHVGVLYQSPEIFTRTMQQAKAVFEIAAELGNPMTVLDLGGGFPGGLRNIDKYKEVCISIRRAIDEYFPASKGVQIIAEPGQYFVTSAYYLAVRVVCKRRRDLVIDGVLQPHQDVFVNESRDNCVSRHLYQYSDVRIVPLQEPLERPRNVLTTLWGGTCNPLDLIDPEKLFFDVDVDEWLLMDNMGAYTLSFACGFNGTGFPAVHYICPHSSVGLIRQMVQRSLLRSGYTQPEEALKEDLLTRKQELLHLPTKPESG